MGMFDFDNHDFIGVPSGKYFDMVRGIDELTSENEHLKNLNKNQMNTIIVMRNEITDLKKQNRDLCELVGKTKKERKDYEAMRNEPRSLQDENAARIEAYEKLHKRYKELVNDYSKAMVKNIHYGLDNYCLQRKLDAGCNTCPNIENTKKKNDELKELVDFKRTQIENQADTIRDLDKKIAELRAGAKDLQEQNQILKDEIATQKKFVRKLQEQSDDYWNRRQVWKDKYDQLRETYETETTDLKKKLKSVCENCDVPDNCVNASEAVLKDADAKIQSANDKAANAKKEAKQAKETAERYREENFVLTRKIDQLTRLNDELIKEFARQQNAELILKFDRKGETNGNANSD